MTEITAQSIDEALRKQLDALNTSVESREVGSVVQIGDGSPARVARSFMVWLRTLRKKRSAPYSWVTSLQSKKMTSVVPLAAFSKFLPVRV